MSQEKKGEDPGCLMSWADFINDSKEFVKRSNKLNDSWSFCGKTEDFTSVGDSYLIKKAVKHCDRNISNPDLDHFGDNDITFWEYHILYSVSYSVPVLYFNAWKRDGSILFINDFIKLNESQVKNHYHAQTNFIISQQSHPILHCPFYYIHPCDSIEILKSCNSIAESTDSKTNRLIMWLSIVAPVINIDLPTDFAAIS